MTPTGDVTGFPSKEREGERGSTPHTPLKEKGEGKEIALPLRVSAARAPACAYAEEQPGFVPPVVARAPAPKMPAERNDIPSLEVVLASCDATGVSKTYARWWHGQMAASGWVTTKGLRIDNMNWRANLCSWYRKQDPKELRAAEEAEQARQKTRALVVVKPEDWNLCKERCANCTGAGCSAGVKVPPDKIPGWQIPPEQCPKFRALAEEGGAK